MIVGVDTHKHVHVAVAIDTWGIRLGDRSCAADSDGYQQLITWAERHGRVAAFGIEGTGSYGAGLARAVRRAGHQVLEVNRGDRRTRRIAGKSDTVDAETAARSVLAGQSTAIPKTADGAVEMMRHLKVARRTAVNARTAAMITLKQIVVTAPPALREPLHPLADQALLTRCRGWRCGTIDTPTASAKHTLLVPTKNLIRTVCVTDRAVLGRRTITSVGMADVRSVEVDGRLASFGRSSGRRVSVHGLQAPAIRGCGQAACRW